MDIRIGIKSDPIESRYSFDWLFGIMKEYGADRLQYGSSTAALLVDDEYDTREVLGYMLRQSGANVATATNAAARSPPIRWRGSVPVRRASPSPAGCSTPRKSPCRFLPTPA